MANLKLGRLPDRTPVRLTISVSPVLNQRLLDYAGAYRETYGREESVSDLIPEMLADFLDGDREFTRYRRSLRPRLNKLSRRIGRSSSLLSSLHGWREFRVERSTVTVRFAHRAFQGNSIWGGERRRGRASS